MLLSGRQQSTSSMKGPSNHYRHHQTYIIIYLIYSMPHPAPLPLPLPLLHSHNTLSSRGSIFASSLFPLHTNIIWRKKTSSDLKERGRGRGGVRRGGESKGKKGTNELRIVREAYAIWPTSTNTEEKRTQTHARTHTHARTNTHACTHTHAHTHPHARTHPHTLAPIL